MKHECKATPICPYCGTVETEVWDLDLMADDSNSVWCGGCGYEYAVVVHVTYAYTSSMPTATPVSWWSRDKLCDFLESRGYEVYDQESTRDLREAAQVEMELIKSR